MSVNGLWIAPLLPFRLYKQGRLHTRGVVSRALLPRPAVSARGLGLHVIALLGRGGNFCHQRAFRLAFQRQTVLAYVDHAVQPWA